MRIDLTAAFAASGAKALAYAVISSLLLAGGSHAADFAMFTLIRSTLGLLNYATLGIAPALIRQLSRSIAIRSHAQALPAGESESISPERLYASAMYPALMIGAAALVLLAIYSSAFDTVHNVPESLLAYAPWSALCVGLAMLFRLLSDIPGGWLQASHKITLDNMLLMSADLLWPVLTWLLLRLTPTPLLAASLAFCICYFFLAISRLVAAGIHGAPIRSSPSLIDRPTAHHLLAFGLLLTLSQLSDFLYAPTDFLLVNWFLTPEHLTDYSVAVQLDAGLLLLTSAVATVLYPRASRAVAVHDVATLRKYYRRGTLLTTILLIVAAVCLVLVSKPLLLVWLKTDRPGARAVLPLLLMHTIIGGSTAPARAILFAAGKARVFAISAVAAGVLNVAISTTLLIYTDLELVGVIIGTVVAVFFRCVIFIPWYTMRVLRNLPTRASELPPDQSTIAETV